MLIVKLGTPPPRGWRKRDLVPWSPVEGGGRSGTSPPAPFHTCSENNEAFSQRWKRWGGTEFEWEWEGIISFLPIIHARHDWKQYLAATFGCRRKIFLTTATKYVSQSVSFKSCTAIALSFTLNSYQNIVMHRLNCHISSARNRTTYLMTLSFLRLLCNLVRCTGFNTRVSSLAYMPSCFWLLIQSWFTWKQKTLNQSKCYQMKYLLLI